jgi:hypothetical protein
VGHDDALLQETDESWKTRGATGPGQAYGSAKENKESN